MDHTDSLLSASIDKIGNRLSTISPLGKYALNGLQKCWMPQHWSLVSIFIIWMVVINRMSLWPERCLLHAERSSRYLTGESNPEGIDVKVTFERNALQLLSLPVATYAFGMALWAAAELKLQIPRAWSYVGLRVLLSDKRNWWSFRAQDLGDDTDGGRGSGAGGSKEMVSICGTFVWILDRAVS